MVSGGGGVVVELGGGGVVVSGGGTLVVVGSAVEVGGVGVGVTELSLPGVSRGVLMDADGTLSCRLANPCGRAMI